MTYAVPLLLALSSCVSVIERDGPDAQGYRWVKDGAVGEPVVHTGVDVFLMCGQEKKALSCAVIRDGVCRVFLPEEPQPWQLAHELRHCEGWRHPK